jgi:hypothetical protein
VTRLPALSQPTFDVGGSSAEIDRLVRQKLRAGEPLYGVDEARLAALAPDPTFGPMDDVSRRRASPG